MTSSSLYSQADLAAVKLVAMITSQFPVRSAPLTALVPSEIPTSTNKERKIVCVCSSLA
jgi:hypothetical protein